MNLSFSIYMPELVAVGSPMKAASQKDEAKKIEEKLISIG